MKAAKSSHQFDYSGSQCLKALREEGVETVLVNPNIATIQTDRKLADIVYLLPVTPEFVEKVIEEEKPDAILLGFGGQTALNCGVQLDKLGILTKYGVKVIGTPIAGIEATEDRDLFKKTMIDAGIPVPKSEAANTLQDARRVARDLGYPVIVRVAYTLGGRGGGVAYNEYQLDEIVQRGFAASIAHQVLVEEYVGGWKQIEYEVMRDEADNCITVCNMENVLGMRVHTGDNIVVAPSQTLTNREYFVLRGASIRATRACRVVGECNIQFALDPKSEDYYAIEINARLSRSSALASKATGYPLAYIAAKLALGYTLPELLNKVTGMTTACFEPALDYVVVKMPRWDLQKFERASRRIGTQMKSVGEVMAIGRCFEEALQKAVRMLDIGRIGVVSCAPSVVKLPLEVIEDQLIHPTDEVLFRVAEALEAGLSEEQVCRLSEIDLWFIEKIKNIVQMEERLRSFSLKDEVGVIEVLKEAKRIGFSDRQISLCLGLSESEVRELRRRLGIIPIVKQIDTLAAEWPAKTNYLYVTYGGETDDVQFTPSRKVIVLGAGTYRIGSSVEFDWCTMNMVWALKKNGVEEAIVVNCNPETVSTDYDMSDKLYFEELTYERVLDIYEKEKPIGVVASVGGQTANNVAPKLARSGVQLLGTSSRDIDRAEDRSKFSALLDRLKIPQPPWSTFTSIEEAYSFCKKVGYPVLVRPSYVLSGAAMTVVYTSRQLERFLTNAARVSPEYPVVISKFIKGALEVEVDAVSDCRKIVIGSVIEHVEKAGVHSGDAIMVIPPQKLPEHVVETVVCYAERIAKALRIRGPFNVQYVVKGGKVFVIECNLRASRSMPFVSKFTGLNLMDISAEAILNGSIPEHMDTRRGSWSAGVKAPQFSFMQLDEADPVLGVEMQSTGEVACFGVDFYDALLKASIAAGYRIPRLDGNVLVTVGGPELKKRILPLARDLRRLGYRIFATEHTAEYLAESGVSDVGVLFKISEPERKPNILDYLAEGSLDLIINIPETVAFEKYAGMLEDEYLIRRKAVELGVPVITRVEAAQEFVKGLAWLKTHKPSTIAFT